MKASSQGEGLQVSSSLIPPGPASKVYNAIINRDLILTSGKERRATAIECIVLWNVVGSILDSPDKKLKKRVLMPGTEKFCNLWLLDEA